ncbi:MULTISPECIES: ABC transporter substrate-binding protein [Thioclava]|uniref:ABC transporter substrate-binding protein n=1 Tax=Thioclava litoralis TaxID=3076557 RepID=A0ABZ1E275_9RHOB|nr:ABC transporter substrate-binding protein [Thioclava sp. FTW29]
MLTRRRLLKSAVATGLAGAAVTGLPMPALAKTRTLKIGFVTPTTGPLAIFAEPDQFVLDQYRAALKDGLEVNGTRHPVEFIVKDSQSSSNRASSVAQELIFEDEVDLICASATPDTTNPVADQAELNGVPCITNDTPWQAHFFGRGGDPKVGFDYTFHYFWGLEDIIAVFMSHWAAVDSNKVVGAMWPNDPDGNSWSNSQNGFPAEMSKAGYKLVDTGRYQNGSDDFSAQIQAFKKAGVEVVTGVMIPPDFNTFWTQAAQQGFTPKVVDVAKASEFPQAMSAMGPRAEGLSVEVTWHKNFPFRSAFSGQSCEALAAAYEAATGNPWTMPLGTKHSLFDVATNVLSRTQDIDDADSIVEAIRATDLETVLGRVNFQDGPVPNISKTPLVGGQWKLGSGTPQLEIVTNSNAPQIPLTAQMLPIKA